MFGAAYFSTYLPSSFLLIPTVNSLPSNSSPFQYSLFNYFPDMSRAKSTSPARGSSSPSKSTTNPASEPQEYSSSVRQRAAGAPSEGILYIFLWIRSALAPKDHFHWGFYYQKATQGKLYHLAYQKNTWTPQHVTVNNFMDAKLLCVLIAISYIPEEKEKELDKTMKSHDKFICDNHISDWPGFPTASDQFWVCRKLVPDLVKAGLVRCDSVQTVNSECRHIGNIHRETASLGLKPRPVRFLTSCQW
jgi:hypothetical protein